MADAINNADLLERLSSLDNELKVQKQMADALDLQRQATQQQVNDIYTSMKYHDATYSVDDEPKREINYPGSGNFWKIFNV